MIKEIKKEKLDKYLNISKKALSLAKKAKQKPGASEILDMAERYLQDAEYFMNTKKDYVLAFAAINYAHGWLDCGARKGFYDVKDNSLFTVDEF